jgi:cytochrome c2
MTPICATTCAIRRPKVKGNHMPFSGFAHAREADDVVAYLQTYK